MSGPVKSQAAAPSRLIEVVERFKPDFEAFETVYRHIHQDPELSCREAATAKLVADFLRDLDFAVEENIGGHGVVGILRNGPGRVILLRAELDALQVEEQTGLPFASKKRMLDEWDKERPVMHACGHDMHMTCLLAASKLLYDARHEWSGTLMALFQPNEEHTGGAKAMVNDGLYNKIPVPDVAFAQHGMPMKSGMISLKPGPILVSSDLVNLRLYASYGYKANPQIGANPVRTALKIITQLDSLVEELGRDTYAAINVEEFHAGRPGLDQLDHADVVMDFKTFDQGIRHRFHEGLKELVKRESKASGAKQAPEINITERAQMTQNSERLVNVLRPVFEEHFGSPNMIEQLPSHPVEDFSYLATARQVPYVFWFVGRVDPKAWEDAEKNNEVLERVAVEHSPCHTVDLRRTLNTGTDALSLAALSFFIK